MVLLLEHMSLDARAATDVDAAIVSQVLRLDSMTKKMMPRILTPISGHTRSRLHEKHHISSAGSFSLISIF